MKTKQNILIVHLIRAFLHKEKTERLFVNQKNHEIAWFFSLHKKFTINGY